MKSQRQRNMLEAGLIFSGLMFFLRIFITPMLPGVLQDRIEAGLAAAMIASLLLLAGSVMIKRTRPVKIRAREEKYRILK